MKRVTIIGAGPSGLMAAIMIKSLAKEKNEKVEVTILEKNERVGKKILSTGNGKCNFTNINVNPKYYNDSLFVKPIIDSFTPSDLQTWFAKRGLLSKVDSEGRVYPITENASSVLDILRIELEKHEVKVIHSFSVNKLKKKGKGYIISDGKNSIFTDILIISTGGQAAPVLGSTGDAVKLLDEFGVTFTKRYPGLVGLKTAKEDIKGLSGLRMKAEVTLVDNETEVFKEKGEIQFKDDGISGIVVMNATSKLVRNHTLKMYIDFLPTLEVEEITEYIKNKQVNYGNFEIINLLIGLVPNVFGIKILKDLGINATLKIKHLEKSAILKIASILKRYKIHFISPYGYDRAQVTVGGIDLREVNENLELLKLANTYVCGEVLDIDGLCGGYNLHFAFASAMYVSRKVVEQL